MDRIEVSAEILYILRQIMTKEELINLGDKIDEMNSCEGTRLPELSRYIAGRISEWNDNGKLDKKYKIVNFLDDDDYKILQVFDTLEEANDKLEHWQEQFLRYDVDIILAF